MLTASEQRKLTSTCAGLDTGPDYRDADYVRNMLMTALDFQLRVSAVNKAIAFYEENLWNSIRTHGDIKGFLRSYPNTKSGNLKAAQELWSNNCWTRVEFLRSILDYFGSIKVNDMKHLRSWAKTSNFNQDVKGRIRSQHHSMGPAIYYWLLLRVGIPTIKPDLHVRHFVKDCIGRAPSLDETMASLLKCAQELGREPHELDAAIWHYQSGYA